MIDSVIETVLESPLAPAVRRSTSSSDLPVLDVDGLTVRYGAGAPAVRDAALVLRSGARLAIVGESGSGKTTLGMAVAGFLPAAASVTADRLVVAGTDRTAGTPRGALPVRTPGVSVILQDAMTSLDPVWSIGSQLVAVLRATEGLDRAAAADRARDWLVRVGLTDTARVLASRPGQLSGGMRQRVMVALALAGRPRLLIADEPTSALDASLSRTTMELLAELTDETGAALLMITHDVSLCLRYAHEIAVMYRGEIVERGTPDALRAHARHPYTAGLLRCVPTLSNWEVAELPTMGAIA